MKRLHVVVKQRKGSLCKGRRHGRNWENFAAEGKEQLWVQKKETQEERGLVRNVAGSLEMSGGGDLLL